MTRASSEVAAYQHGSHRKHRQKVQSRFAHVAGAPNTVQAMERYDAILRAAIVGRPVLEVGCGNGWNCRRLLDWGAASVDGIDISPEMLSEAQSIGDPRLRFFEHDIHQPLADAYDVIFGRAILHHVDYQTVLRGLYDHNLNPGGEMLFMEPLGSSVLMKLYWKMGEKYHTPGERPFFRSDLRWLSANFPDLSIIPFNYFSLPAGLVSSFLFSQPDNWLMRACDRIDRSLADGAPFLAARFRSVIFHFRKPTWQAAEKVAGDTRSTG